MIDSPGKRDHFFLQSLTVKWVAQPLAIRLSYDQEKMLTKQRGHVTVAADSGTSKGWSNLSSSSKTFTL